MPRITDWEGITKLPNGRYLVRVEVAPFPRKSKRFPAGTKQDKLLEWRDGTRAKLREKKKDGPQPGTLAEDIAKYLQQWGTGKHAQTREQRERHLRFWVQAFGDRARDSLTTAEIERQLALWQTKGLPLSRYSQERGRLQKPLKSATIRKVRQALYQVYAVLDRGTERVNPVAAVPAGTDPEADPKGLPMEIVRRVLAAMPPGKTKARCYVVAYTALRPPHEVIALKPEDVDLKGRKLFVRSGKGSTRTTIPLTRRGAAALRYFAYWKAWGYFTSAPVNLRLHEAAAKIDLPDLDITAYALRHSFGTWHYQTFGDLEATRLALRHRSISMTRRYTRAAAHPVLEQSIRKLDRALRKRRRSSD